jgi:hypothetical protein
MVPVGSQLDIRAYNPPVPIHSQSVITGILLFAAFLGRGGPTAGIPHAAVLDS